MVGAALSALGSLVSVAGHNSAIKAQNEALIQDTVRGYENSSFEATSQHKNLLEQAHVASIERDQAASLVSARTSSLGIRGRTGAELVGEEVRAGNYTVTSAVRGMEDVYTAQVLGDSRTHTAAATRSRSLESQMIDPMSALIGAATAGLQGYNASYNPE